MNKKRDQLIRKIDRIVSGSLGRQIVFFLVIALIVFALLTMISVVSFQSSGEESLNSRFWNMVLNFIDPGAGFDYPSDMEKLLILFTNMIGMVIFNGMLIALLVSAAAQRIEKINNGEVYYLFNSHVVVIGFDHICDELAVLLAQNNEFVLQTSKDVNDVRHELYNTLDIKDKIKNRITIVSGNRTLAEDVKKLNIHKCERVFILGDMDEEAHDSKNIECLEIINKIIEEKSPEKILRCYMLFEHRAAFAAFQQHDISSIRKNIDLVPFNFYDIWAQKLFVKNEYNGGGINGKIEYKPLDHEPIDEESQKRVHLVILGMSEMGVSLGLQAAHICHFPNFISKGIKTRITFIDREADIEMKSMKMSLRGFFDEIDYQYECFETGEKFNKKTEKEIFTDIEFEFIKGNFQDDSVYDFLKKAARDKSSYLTIAAALPQSSDSLTAALYLPQEVFDGGASVFVRQNHSSAIVSMLSKGGENEIYRKYKNMRPFGMIHNFYDLGDDDDILPMMIKYAYETTNKTTGIIKDWDFSDRKKILDVWKDWSSSDNLSALKASNRYAANFIKTKKRSLGIKEGAALNDKQIFYAARVEHNRWIIEKLLVGFRAPSPQEIDDLSSGKTDKKTLRAHFIHPDIKPYEVLEGNELKIDVKVYDINISNAAPYILKALNARED